MGYQGLKHSPAVPASLQVKLDKYVEEGQEPGGFLRAIISNDLGAAIMNSDEDNLAAIPNIYWYLFSSCPAEGWGSPEKYVRWLK